MINASHIGSAKERVTARCLVAVNVNEKSPSTLFDRIRIKRLINIIMLIFFDFRRTANSTFILDIIFLTKLIDGDDITHIRGVSSKMNIHILIQFNGINIIAAGSKIENKLFIIVK